MELARTETVTSTLTCTKKVLVQLLFNIRNSTLIGRRCADRIEGQTGVIRDGQEV